MTRRLMPRFGSGERSSAAHLGPSRTPRRATEPPARGRPTARPPLRGARLTEGRESSDALASALPLGGGTITRALRDALPSGDWAGSSRLVTVMTHTYAWGNNEKRASLKGRHCRVVANGRMRSVLVEFENGERVVTSQRALRRGARRDSRGSRDLADAHRVRRVDRIHLTHGDRGWC